MLWDLIQKTQGNGFVQKNTIITIIQKKKRKKKELKSTKFEFFGYSW